MPLSKARIIVTGKVQGVYYRDTTKRKAQALGLTGAAYNLKDKSVEIVAEGEKEKINELITFCKKGPEAASEVGITSSLARKRRVDDVRVAWLESGGDRSFSAFKNGGSK